MFLFNPPSATCVFRTVNSSRTDTSNTSAIEASASSSSASSVLVDTGLDLSCSRTEVQSHANLSVKSESVEDEETLDTKDDQHFG